MRIRQVKPEFWSDAKLYRLPAWMRLFYIGLWMEADDGGWLRWDPEQLAMDLLRDQPLDTALEMVAEARRTFKDLRRLHVARCGHAEIPKLADHQRLSGETRRVYTFTKEHEQCALRNGHRGHPRGTAGETRGAPPG